MDFSRGFTGHRVVVMDPCRWTSAGGIRNAVKRADPSITGPLNWTSARRGRTDRNGGSVLQRIHAACDKLGPAPGRSRRNWSGEMPGDFIYLSLQRTKLGHHAAAERRPRRCLLSPLARLTTDAFIHREARESADICLLAMDARMRPAGTPRRLTSRRTRMNRRSSIGDACLKLRTSASPYGGIRRARRLRLPRTTGSGTHGMVTTMRGFPGMSQASSISDRETFFVAIWRPADATAAKTFLIASSSFEKGTLLTPLPIN